MGETMYLTLHKCVLCAGAHFADEGLKYVCVAGRSVRGDGMAPRRSLSRYAYGSYQQVRPGPPPDAVQWTQCIVKVPYKK